MSESIYKYENSETPQNEKLEIKIIEKDALISETKNEIITSDTPNQNNIFERLKNLQVLLQKYSCIKEICTLISLIYIIHFLLL